MKIPSVTLPTVSSPLFVPPPLFPGARVALLCPSGPVQEERLLASQKALLDLGLRPVVFDSAKSKEGYLAGPDSLRAEDLNQAFADSSIDGILALRGGYGAHRLLPLLDFSVIGQNPKYFGGYSDITALHTAFVQLCGFVTYHTIMPATNYFTPIDDYSMLYLKRSFFSGLAGPLYNPADQPLISLSSGSAAAPLCGGNLTVLTDSLGTPWEIDTKGKILFLEEVHEPHYRVDAMLTQLRNAGKLSSCAGILLGAFTEPEVEAPAEDDIPLQQIFTSLLPSGIPILSGLACGHVLPSLALPMGAILVMDADRKTLQILPSDF